jgi:hypothetical protein
MKLSNLAVILAAASLAACGSDPKQKSVPDVTVSYAGSEDPIAIESPSDVGALAMSARDGSALVSGAASSFISMAGVVKAPAFGVKQAMERVAKARRDRGASFVGGLASFSGACDVAGTATMSFYEYDEDPATTHAGDYMEIAFSNCWDYDGSGTDGSFRLTSTTAGGDWSDPASSGYASFGFDLTFTNLLTVSGGAYTGLDGDLGFTYVIDPTSFLQSFEMSGSGIAGVEGDAASGTIHEAFLLVGLDGFDYSDTFVEHYADSYFAALDYVEWGFNGGICSTEMGGCLAIETEPLFAQYADEPYPYDGVFTISDGANSAMIEAYDGATGSIYVSYDLDGDFSWDATWDTSWTCLETQTDASACFTEPAY